MAWHGMARHGRSEQLKASCAYVERDATYRERQARRASHGTKVRRPTDLQIDAIHHMNRGNEGEQEKEQDVELSHGDGSGGRRGARATTQCTCGTQTLGTYQYESDLENLSINQ